MPILRLPLRTNGATEGLVAANLGGAGQRGQVPARPLAAASAAAPGGYGGHVPVVPPPAQPGGEGLRVQVRRSARRRRSVTAYREGDVVVVAIPARFSRAQEREWVERMLGRLQAQDRRRRPSDEALVRRAAALSTRYLGGGPRPTSVRWEQNMRTRWGSCTPADGTVRISARLRGVPPWVLDYVLLHELAHLVEPRHGPAFWALLDGYPRTERARGYLEGLDAAGRLGGAGEEPDGEESDGEPPDGEPPDGEEPEGEPTDGDADPAQR